MHLHFPVMWCVKPLSLSEVRQDCWAVSDLITHQLHNEPPTPVTVTHMQSRRSDPRAQTERWRGRRSCPSRRRTVYWHVTQSALVPPGLIVPLNKDVIQDVQPERARKPVSLSPVLYIKGRIRTMTITGGIRDAFGPSAGMSGGWNGSNWDLSAQKLPQNNLFSDRQ